jgi:hypothetical protein
MQCGQKNSTGTPDVARVAAWQFSLRALFLSMAVLSVILAVAVNMPMLFVIALMAATVAAVLQGISLGVTFATSEKRPRLATVSWAAFALFFFAAGAAFFNARFLISGFAFFCCGIISSLRALQALLLVLKRNG